MAYSMPCGSIPICNESLNWEWIRWQLTRYTWYGSNKAFRFDPGKAFRDCVTRIMPVWILTKTYVTTYDQGLQSFTNSHRWMSTGTQFVLNLSDPESHNWGLVSIARRYYSFCLCKYFLHLVFLMRKAFSLSRIPWNLMLAFTRNFSKISYIWFSIQIYFTSKIQLC